MTDKEKAQAYDEALEFARKLIKETWLSQELKDSLKQAFPELAESEDEKNIKDLIDELKRSLRAANCQNEACNGGHEKRIALLEWALSWLEEKKHDGKKWIYADEYYKDLDRLYQDGYEQGVIDCQKEQKPAEWNEEDEETLTSCIGAVYAADYYTFDNKKELERWLNSLKERMGGKL